MSITDNFQIDLDFDYEIKYHCGSIKISQKNIIEYASLHRIKYYNLETKSIIR